MNMQTLERAAADPEPVPDQLVDPAAGPDVQPKAPTDDKPPGKQDELASMRGLLADGVLRTYRRQKRIADQTAKASADVKVFEASMMANLASDGVKALADIRTAVEAVGVFACGQRWGWWGDYTTAAFLKMMVPSVLRLSVAAFESGDVVPYIEQREVGLANSAADTLLKACLVAAKATQSMEVDCGRN